MEAPKECTNKELYLIIQANHEETMREVAFIKEQTTKTNGSVRDCKGDIEALKLWRSGIVAGIAVISFAIPLAIKAIFK